jgi:hypothetical protein
MIKFVNLKYTYSDLDACHFYVAQNTKYLNIIFYTFVRQIVGYIQIFFFIFLKT